MSFSWFSRNNNVVDNEVRKERIKQIFTYIMDGYEKYALGMMNDYEYSATESDMIDSLGNTLYHIAVMRNSEYLLKELINRFGIIDIQNKVNKTPVDLAIEQNNVNLVKILLNHVNIYHADYDKLKKLYDEMEKNHFSLLKSYGDVLSEKITCDDNYLSLKISYDMINNENKDLKSCVTSCKNNNKNIKNKYQSIMISHTTLEKNNKELEKENTVYKTKNKRLFDENTDLNESNKKLKKNYEDVKQKNVTLENDIDVMSKTLENLRNKK